MDVMTVLVLIICLSLNLRLCLPTADNELSPSVDDGDFVASLPEIPADSAKEMPKDLDIDSNDAKKLDFK